MGVTGGLAGVQGPERLAYGLWNLGAGEARGSREPPKEGPFNSRVGVWNILKRKEDFKQGVRTSRSAVCKDHSGCCAEN